MIPPPQKKATPSYAPARGGNRVNSTQTPCRDKVYSNAGNKSKY